MKKCKDCKEKDKVISELKRRIEAINILDPYYKNKSTKELEVDAAFIKAAKTGSGDAFDCFGS